VTKEAFARRYLLGRRWLRRGVLTSEAHADAGKAETLCHAARSPLSR
jgi:hypothetical protein